jgi:hypothetical protein
VRNVFAAGDCNRNNVKGQHPDVMAGILEPMRQQRADAN